MVIAPNYSKLNGFIDNLPSTFESEGHLIYSARNQVKVFDVEGVAINVKRYCIPPFFFNRIVYRFFRAPKAKRAYYYGFRLDRLEIQTPTPIGYIVEKRSWLVGRSYFISLQVPYHRDMREFGEKSEIDDESNLILTEFGKFTAELHSKGIYHKDYSPGNVMFRMVDGVPEFCLVDINRMKFGKVSIAKGCKNFSRLWGNTQVFGIIAKSYSTERGVDPDSTLNQIIKYRKIL